MAHMHIWHTVALDSALARAVVEALDLDVEELARLRIPYDAGRDRARPRDVHRRRARGAADPRRARDRDGR